jgi:4-phytase/acid phosphatase
VLSAEAAPPGARAIDRKLIVFVGHDTNLSNLAGAFGLTWSLPGQPDATAPGVALAFERWRDPATNDVSVRLRLFYQTPDQVRNLSADLSGPVSVTPAGCPADGGACPLARLAEAVNARLPTDCFIGPP